MYVDYSVTKDSIFNDIDGNGNPWFPEYEVESKICVEDADLMQGGRTPSESRTKEHFNGEGETFNLFVVLGRKEGYSKNDGPRRLAILFIGGDGISIYHDLYCQNNHQEKEEDKTPKPFLVLLQDHNGFGVPCLMGQFGQEGPLHKLALRHKVFPRWLLVGEETEPWGNYVPVEAGPVYGGFQCNRRELYGRG